MTGALPFNLEKGLFWGAVIEIAATGLQRRKVIFELSGGAFEPSISLLLNDSDFMFLTATDRNGVSVSTEPINPLDFAFKRGLLYVEAYIDQSKSTKSADSLILKLHFDEIAAVATSHYGSYSGDVLDGLHSFGAASDGSDPSSFKLYELIALGRAPLEANEMSDLKLYVKQKHGLV